VAAAGAVAAPTIGVVGAPVAPLRFGAAFDLSRDDAGA
jgi:hypothetical protein